MKLQSNEDRLLRVRQYLINHSSDLISYQQLAAKMTITRAPVIRTITQILEQLIDEDIRLERPILSSLVVQKNRTYPIPRQGFFEYLAKLGVYSGSVDGEDALRWHQIEIAKVRQFYKNNLKNGSN